jgi:hypothetical protein
MTRHRAFHTTDATRWTNLTTRVQQQLLCGKDEHALVAWRAVWMYSFRRHTLRFHNDDISMSDLNRESHYFLKL